ncbi:MAG: hypothetical protein AMJ56_05030 [Anaerolineae bacterium SG8_19]|nr:MAG: hypothetical protein AMJ56_05030 [Anaerolineae bacterium SG8_19]
MFLAHNVGKISRILEVPVKGLSQVNGQRLDRFEPRQMANNVANGWNRQNFDVGHQRRFSGVDGRDEDPVVPLLPGHCRHGQDALGMAHCSVEGKLAHNQRTIKLVWPDLLGGSQDANGNRQVVSWTFFSQIGRG